MLVLRPMMSKARRAAAPASAPPGPTAPEEQSTLAPLEAKDPAFDRAFFLEKVKHDVARLYGAWSLRELGPVRDMLSDATWQRLKTQLDLLHRQGVRDAITDLRVFSATPVSLSIGRVYDSVEVAILASLRDSEVPAGASDEAALARARAAPAEDFTEYWTFVRSAAATTRSTEGCPQCGAPFAGNAAAQCTHCQAIINSGQFDWVLTEMTQSPEVQAQQLTPPGLARLEARDPAFSREVLEDRASLIFWKWITAHETSEAKPVAKLATPAFFTKLEGELERRAKQNLRRVVRKAAVGAVITRRLTVEDGFDVAACEVRWSAMGRMDRSVLILKRRNDATTDPKRGLSTMRCPPCGAPLSDNGQPTCEFCGEALAANATDWVLDELLTWEGFISRRPREDAPATPALAEVLPVESADRDERVRMLQQVAGFARVDGVVAPQERALLTQLAEQWKVPWAEVEPTLHGVVEPPPWPTSSPEAEVLLVALIDCSLADGQANTQEYEHITAVAMLLGLLPRLQPLLKERRALRKKVT